MIRLDPSTEPKWLDLGSGLRLLVLPVTTATMVAARNDPTVESLPKDASQEQMAVVMAKAVARRVVADWEGVGDQSGMPMSVTPEGIDALLDIWPVFEAFPTRCLAPYLMLDAEKNASSPLPNGTSAGARPTAQPAIARAKIARRG